MNAGGWPARPRAAAALGLGGCVKAYVPWPAGRFGAVMVAVGHPEQSVGLRVIAFSVRHHPREAHALTVYEIAHRRIHR